MKKRCALFLCIVMFCTVLLSGCHGSKGMAEFEIPEDFDLSKQYEITFWAKNDTNIKQTRIYQKAIADFQELYPNITVNLKLYTDYGKIYNDVITNISTNTTPNVCITYPDHIATYKTGTNIVVPLDELMNDAKYGLGGSELKFDSPKKSEIISQFLSEGVIDGVQYALPFMRSTEACYVNKTYVEKLGFELPEVLTWDFIWEVSKAAMAKNDDGTYKINGQNVMIPFIYKSTDNMMIQWLKQSGNGYSSENGEILMFNDGTKEFLYTIADHVSNGEFSTFKISGYPANFLNAGQCIFAIDSTAGATWMGTNAPLVDISDDTIVEFETEVMMIPQVDAENPKMISQGPSICVFNKSDSGEVMASWLFAQYLLTNDVQTAYAKTEGYVPVTQKAVNSDEYKDYISRTGEDNDVYYDIKIKASQIMTDNIDNTFVTPVFNGSASLRNASGQLIENVTKSIRRKETVDDEYMTNLYSDIRSLYRLDQIGTSTVSLKTEFGKLPKESVVLLVSLGVAWILICVYAVVNYRRKRKSKL